MVTKKEYLIPKWAFDIYADNPKCVSVWRKVEGFLPLMEVQDIIAQIVAEFKGWA